MRYGTISQIRPPLSKLERTTDPGRPPQRAAMMLEGSQQVNVRPYFAVIVIRTHHADLQCGSLHGRHPQM
ncbi:hypothetical protein BD310DRAFT_196067 [Dichomitus squalens]|uniref:Uncharacterized protein n=1 Tax=Dichomitus squalens TaxID=114155 RepID=A0A4V2K8V4_9APHY|nr:hypothetical protein BD310DRAFT_196067 [Dichomitus squalens]